MNNKSVIINLPSDLYSRNFIISEGIKEYKKAKGIERASILDVGGRKGKLDLFLDPEDSLSILDIRPGKEKNLVVGDATNMKNFSDGAFDFVVSGDVFEHISPKKREAFIQETLRVSKEMVVLAAPFDTKGVGEAEKKVNDFFKKIIGIDHEWLKEHIDNGLPKKEDLEKIISQSGYKFSLVKSNSLKNWILLQRAIFFAYGFSIFSVKNKFIRSIYRFYNKNILKIENENDDFYRLAYFISRDGFSSSIKYSYDKEIGDFFKKMVFNSFTQAKNGNLTFFAKKILVFLQKAILNIRK